MALTLWMNEFTGRQLDDEELRELRRRSRILYAANEHLFEDQEEALAALGAIPLPVQLRTWVCQGPLETHRSAA